MGTVLGTGMRQSGPQRAPTPGASSEDWRAPAWEPVTFHLSYLFPGENLLPLGPGMLHQVAGSLTTAAFPCIWYPDSPGHPL